MIDRFLSKDAGVTAAGADSTERVAAAPSVLPPGIAWAVTLVAGWGAAAYLHETEGGGAGLFASAAMGTIGALLVALFRRVLPAVVLVSATVAIIRTGSYVKQQSSEVLLHAYDIVSLSSWSALTQFAREHREYAFGLLAAVTATAIITWIALRIDGTRIRRTHAAGAVVLFVLLAILGSVAKGERRHTEFYFENVYVSFFLASWSETIEALWRGALIEAAPSASVAAFNASAVCEPRSKPPHIILIHQESVVPPSHFPSLSYDRSLDSFFHSYDGPLRKLRVETFGGGSWLTEFSVLTGLSTYSFGGMRQFVQQIMAGKVKDTLPQALARCGYRNVVFYPMLRQFLSAGRFFEGVGLHEIYDAKDQGATLPNERDRFYYANLLAEIGRHLKGSKQPLFAYLETMATHGAYDYAYMPELDVPGGNPGTDPEMHEYLRRLAMARMDYAHLRAELSRRFPDQQFLIVHYGDHQPTATWSLLGLQEGTTIEKVIQSKNDIPLTTYYAIDAVRYHPPALPAINNLDVPFLGTIILEAARLTLSDSFRARRRLMLLCKGRYHDCPVRDEILKFQRSLIDAGIVEAR
jgi:hypothetical protein